MEHTRHDVALIGFNEAEAMRIASLLGSFDVTCHRIHWNDAAAQHVASRELDAILLPYPQDPAALTRFLTVIRRDVSTSRHAGVVLLADPPALAAARRFLSRGVNRVVPRDDPGNALREAVLALLDVAHRFPLRAVVELSAMFETGPVTSHCNTENLSMSGMLVSCATRFPVGAPFDFALAIPGEDQPIRGSARVARLTDPGREQVLGMAASFLWFEESHRSRLRNLLLRHVS